MYHKLPISNKFFLIIKSCRIIIINLTGWNLLLPFARHPISNTKKLELQLLTVQVYMGELTWTINPTECPIKNQQLCETVCPNVIQIYYHLTMMKVCTACVTSQINVTLDLLYHYYLLESNLTEYYCWTGQQFLKHNYS